MIDVIINISETIIGGLIFTLILFVLNEYLFKKNNLTGEWDTIVEINETSYVPFKDLKIVYKIHLIQKNYDLFGSGEKIKDIKPDGNETVFLRENRVNIRVDGYFERKYLGKSRVYINIEEVGRKRVTRATYILTLKAHNTLEGTFVSTAADAKGVVILTRK